MTKYLILGAGPSGLTFANRLLQKGVSDFMVLEAEETAGGLCRSGNADGSPIDTGGGHFLDADRTDVCRFLFQFMPEEEWRLFQRNSQIYIHNRCIHHPIEANIWEMQPDEQAAYLASIARAGANTGRKEPLQFVKWVTWKLGDKIADEYMIPYNQKMFGSDLNALGTYWLEKLPDVSFEDTLRSCLEHKAFGKQPGHARFYYPKNYGYGELWLRMAQALENRIRYKKKVQGIDLDKRKVITKDGEVYEASVIITTIPWKEFLTIRGMEESILASISNLKHTSIQIDYYKQNLKTDAHWIYDPDLKTDYHRILVRSNFCIGSRGYWTETNSDRVRGTKSSICSYRNKYAYPLNTSEKPEIMQSLSEWCRKRNIYGLGRWGEHQHYNSDKAVESAIQLAEKLI